MPESVLSSFTPEGFREVMQQAGYRAELMTDRPNLPYLRSATGGVPFEVQFLNRVPSGGQAYADVTFAVVLQSEAKLPLTTMNEWNNMRRFGRLRLVRDMVILDMDLSAVGGVTAAHVRAQLGIWDQLAQDVATYLRNAIIKLAEGDSGKQNGAAEPPPASSVVPNQSTPSPARATATSLT